MNVLVWGTGAGTNGLEEVCQMRGVKIEAYVDNNQKRWGTLYYNCPVINPSDIFSFSWDYIIIASSFENQIREQLACIGISDKRILSFLNNKAECLEKIGPVKYVVIREYTKQNADMVAKTVKFNVSLELVSHNNTMEKRKHLMLVERIHDAFLQAKKHGECVETAYMIGKMWSDFIDNTRPTWSTVEELSELLSNFFRNTFASGMCGGASHLQVLGKLREVDPVFLHDFRVWRSSIEKANIEELSLHVAGNPYGYKINGVFMNEQSLFNHYRAYYCSQLLSDIMNPVVVEIGGGFGGLGYYFMKSRPKAKYINFDLADNLMISSYYLASAFPGKKVWFYQQGAQLNDEIIANYDIILAPNFLLPSLPKQSCDMVINTISLSEMSYETISEYMNQVDRICRKYFYHENLADLSAGYDGYTCMTFPIPATFKKIFSSPSRWYIFDFHSMVHSYLENLYVRKAEDVSL